jgi:hypothetical protein
VTLSKKLILDLIENIQLTEDIRGPSFELISKSIVDYDESKLKRLLGEMIEDEQIVSTGYLKNKKYSLMLFATKARDQYDDQMNHSIYPLAAANGVNLYKLCK